MNQKYIFLLMFLFALQAKTFGQSSSNTPTPLLQTEVSATYSKASLYTILNDIQERYKINFYYSGDLIPLDLMVSVDIKNQPLYKVLNSILKGTSIGYKVVGKQIVLIKSPTQDPQKTNPPSKESLKKDTLVKKINPAIAEPSTMPDDKNLRNIKEWKAGSKGRKKIKSNQKINKDSTHAKPDTLSDQESKTSKKSKLKNEFGLKTARTTKFSIGISLTAGSSFRKLTSGDKEGNDIIKKRNKERSKIAFISEIQCTYYLTSYLGLNAGLGFMNLGEKGSYKDSSDYSNSYDYFTIPLSGSYHYHTGGFFLKAGLGIVPSILLSKGKHHIQYEKLGKLPKKTISDRHFNTAYSIYAEGGFQIKKIILFAGISYRHFLYSTYSSSSALQEVNYLIGITGGVRYSF
jgi:hypothetical protein